MTASLAAPAFLWWWGNVADAQVFLLLSILLWIMHRANIGRLLRGAEGRIGKNAPAEPNGSKPVFPYLSQSGWVLKNMQGCSTRPLSSKIWFFSASHLTWLA